jgi:hypothetical protein
MSAAVAGRALEYVEAYNLHSGDATHIASMYAANVLDLASLDGVFRRFNGISCGMTASPAPSQPGSLNGRRGCRQCGPILWLVGSRMSLLSLAKGTPLSRRRQFVA